MPPYLTEHTCTIVTDICARLAGRLSDDVLEPVRVYYACGEQEEAENVLLLNLADQDVGITADERELIRSVLGNADNPDLHAVPIVHEVPPLRYRFSHEGSTGAPDPQPTDNLLVDGLTAHASHGGRHLSRTWREPLPDAPDGATWMYVLQVIPGTDRLLSYSGLGARQWTELRHKWPIEIVVEGAPLLPYPAAALAAATHIWSA